MHLILYVSDYVGDDVTADIADIVATSKKNNLQLEITGVLFHQNGRFLQFLEGEHSAVRKTMERIAADERHTGIRYLFDESIAERGLSDWSMDCFELAPNKELDFDFLQQIRDGYKQTFQANTNALVSIFKSFVAESV